MATSAVKGSRLPSGGLCVLKVLYCVAIILASPQLGSVHSNAIYVVILLCINRYGQYSVYQMAGGVILRIFTPETVQQVYYMCIICNTYVMFLCITHVIHTHV